MFYAVNGKKMIMKMLFMSFYQNHMIKRNNTNYVGY